VVPGSQFQVTATSAPALAAGATLDSTTSKDLGFVFFNDTGASITITKVGLLQSALANSPGTLRIGIQGVSATTGLNSGTWLGATNSAYVDVTSYSSGNNDLFVEFALGESVTIAPGGIFCIYAKPQSGSWDASNSVSYRYNITGTPTERNPYMINNGAKVASTLGVVYYKTSTNTYGFPIQTITTINSTSSSNPGEFGLKFTMPTYKCTTFKVAGLRVTVSITGTRATTINLYDTDGSTVIATGAIDTDNYIAGAGTDTYLFTTNPLPTLNAGSIYRASIQPASTSSGSYYKLGVPAAADMLALSPYTLAYCTRNGISGAWTDDTLTLPTIQLLVVDMTIPAASMVAPLIGPSALVRA
jgi:hypothetical protein